MIIALAGRRIDVPGAEVVRFPLERADEVRQNIRDLFERQEARALVCSGACGADLLALDAAGELGLRRCMVLPFCRDRFRKTSVADCLSSGKWRWGDLFDRIANDLAQGDLMVLENAGEGAAAYAAANIAILEEAIRLAGSGAAPERVLAVIVWDGALRPGHDLTANFAEAAHRSHIDVVHVLTC